MNIYLNLPNDLQRKIMYYTMEHPCAKLIKDEIERLNCNKIFKIKLYGKHVMTIKGIDFFSSEYFLQFSPADSEVSSIHSELFNTLFNPSETSDDDF